MAVLLLESPQAAPEPARPLAWALQCPVTDGFSSITQSDLVLFEI